MCGLFNHVIYLRKNFFVFPFQWLINPLRDTFASIGRIDMDMDIEMIWSMNEDDGWCMYVYLIMFLLIWNRVISIGNVLFVFCFVLFQMDFILLRQQIAYLCISSSEEGGSKSNELFAKHFRLVTHNLMLVAPETICIVLLEKKKEQNVVVACKIASYEWIHHWSMS